MVSLLPFHWFLFFSWRSWKAQWCLFWQSCNQRSDWVQHTFLLVVACRIIQERMMKLDLWFRIFLYTARVTWCINHNSYFKTATFFIISRLVHSPTGVTKEKFQHKYIFQEKGDKNKEKKYHLREMTWF